MKFSKFYDSLSADQAQDYARRCGTSFLYLRNHLRVASRVPRPALLNSLWRESDGRLTRQDVLDHFLPSQKGDE